MDVGLIVCHLELSPHSWPWPFFNVKFLKSCISGMVDWHGMKGMRVNRTLDPLCDLEQWPWALDLGFSWSNFEKAIFQEWDGRMRWNKRDVSWSEVWPTLRLCSLISPMTLTLDFQGQISEKLYIRIGRIDWQWRKGIWVDRLLDPLCDFDFWPHPWSWTWILKVKFSNRHISGMGGPIDKEQN